MVVKVVMWCFRNWMSYGFIWKVLGKENGESIRVVGGFDGVVVVRVFVVGIGGTILLPPSIRTCVPYSLGKQLFFSTKNGNQIRTLVSGGLNGNMWVCATRKLCPSFLPTVTQTTTFIPLPFVN